MKYALLVLLLAFSPAALTQQPKSKTTQPGKAAAKPKSGSTAAQKTTVKTKPGPVVAKRIVVKPKSTPVPLSEKERFDRASAHELAPDRVSALEKFLADFPRTENRAEASELLASSRVLIAEEKLLTGESADAVAVFRVVIERAPQPIPNELFTESIAKIPATLFFRGQRSAALELAVLIESKVEGNGAQLLELANFYLGIENGSEAMRIAAKAAAKDPGSAGLHRTLALAQRINFDLELSADSYAKALEVEPESFESKMGLAEMKRALGKSDEAVALYGELVKKNENSRSARTGLILALFDAGKQTDAEAEMARSLEQTPGNVVLLAGASYWYASKGMGEKAVELGQKAVEKEPRYIWSHIALARGLMSVGKPVEAEQVLIKARAFGNFPTLEYELASARMAAGFFREAVEDLQRHFTVGPNGSVRTSLGGRVMREEKSLAALVAFERKASIFTPASADAPEIAEALRALLVLDQKLQAAEPNEGEIAAAADAFAKGSDGMRLHRQMHAASMLLQKRIAIGKVLEFAKAATGNTDAGLEVANPRSAVLAGELYEARAAAFRKNEFLLVPDVPKQTLLAILRGRIEEITGWAFYQQNNFPDAVVRLRRAISVMPDKSAWWRSSMWRLGAALAADGKEPEALISYIESYKTDKPDFAKYTVVEALYKKLNGTTEGLEEKLGRDRVAATQAVQQPQPAPSPLLTAVEAPPQIASTAVTAAEPPTQQTPVPPPVTESLSSRSSTSTPVDAIKTGPLKTEPAKTVEGDPVERSQPPPTDTSPTLSEPVKQVPAEEPIKPDPKPEVAVEKSSVTKSEVVENAVRKPAALDQSPAAVSTEKPKAGSPKTSTAKPLFEPIIITIPGSRPAKTADGGIKPDKKATVAEKPSETDKAKTDPSVTPGTARRRLIDGQEVKFEETPPCAVGVSQEMISLVNGGGAVGILVSVEAPADIKSMTAISSSPRDLLVTPEPEIVGVPDRRFYVIKSLTSALGIYQVTFAVPCGKKDVVVTVR